jgi:hypothetical protein
LYLIESEASGVKALFSIFNSTDNPIIDNFISRIPETYSQCLTYLSSLMAGPTPTGNDAIYQNKIRMESSIRQFHSRGQTLSTEVENALTRLRDPSSHIFVSVHQPNLFPYSGVFRKIVLAQTLKDRLQGSQQENKIVNLFVVIDRDFMDETWIHRAQLPSAGNSGGILELRYPVRSSERWQMAFKNPVPSSGILYQWKEQIQTWIKKSSPKSSRSDLLKNFGDFWPYVEESQRSARSFADFSSFIMSKLVNDKWNYDTLFVKLSDISYVLKHGFVFLLNNFKTYSSALREAESVLRFNRINDTGVSPNVYLRSPLWIHCTCGSKGSSVIQAHSNHSASLVGKCVSCKKGLSISLGSPTGLAIREDDLPNLSPRAIPILLLLSRELGSTCYISGTGGTSYAVYNAFASHRLSLRNPVFIFWPSTDSYDGFAQSEALKAAGVYDRISLIEHEYKLGQLQNDYLKEISPLLKKRKELLGHEEELQTILRQLFKLKQQQREVRKSLKVARKALKALNIKPCIIDYVVNFAGDGTEALWRGSLERNNSLASEISWK